MTYEVKARENQVKSNIWTKTLVTKEKQKSSYPETAIRLEGATTTKNTSYSESGKPWLSSSNSYCGWSLMHEYGENREKIRLKEEAGEAHMESYMP